MFHRIAPVSGTYCCGLSMPCLQGAKKKQGVKEKAEYEEMEVPNHWLPLTLFLVSHSPDAVPLCQPSQVHKRIVQRNYIPLQPPCYCWMPSLQCRTALTQIATFSL